MTFEDKIKYIAKFKGFGEFVKFTNVDDIPELDDETKNILKNYGVYSYHQGRLITDGKLIKIDDTKIQFGKSPWVEVLYYIDISKNNAIFGHIKSENRSFPVNTSLKKYLECMKILVQQPFLKGFLMCKNKKGETFISPFLPQIYHKLNLLMLWFNKYIVSRFLITNNLDQMHQKSFKFRKC